MGIASFCHPARCYLSNRPCPSPLRLLVSPGRSLYTPFLSLAAAPTALDPCPAYASLTTSYSSRHARFLISLPTSSSRARVLYQTLNSIQDLRAAPLTIDAMSGGVPYSLSNDRASYGAPDHPSAYSSTSGPHSYSYAPYPARNTAYDAGHGRVDSGTAPSSLSGMFHHAEHDAQHHYSRSGHPGDGFSHQSGLAHSRDQVWQYPQAIPDAPRPRLDHSALDMGQSRGYHDAMSHAPSIAGPSHGHGLAGGTSPSSTRSAPTGPSTGRSRREKPRLELAPDQPLTTQGKPRTRVYVACVQWCVPIFAKITRILTKYWYSRNRKIRCDGAKPVCHNCSRRTENPNGCTYDAAPKRRGPDRIPGARQRTVAGSGGERPPRRRRRVTAQDEGDRVYVSPQNVNTSPISPTTQSYMTDPAVGRPEGLTIIQEPPHYSRHRQGLPDAGRSSMAGGSSAHYAPHHDLSISSHVGLSAPLADINAAAHQAHIDPSGRL